MTQLFISHNAADAAVAAQLRDELLAERPGTSVALSSTKDAGPMGGTSWQSWIRRAMSSADLVLFIASEHSLSPWCSAELGMARLLDTPIITLLTAPGATINPVVGALQAVPLDQSIGELLRLVDAQVGGGPTTTVLGPDFVPYPGLAPLGEHQEALLQGRSAERDRLLADFDRLAAEPARVVVVSGPSGSGKSSLVRAGVVPRLRAVGWAITGPTQPRQLHLRGMPEPTPGERTVVVIDQFEEMVLLDDRAREAIVGRITGWVEAGTCVLLVVRSEFRTMIGEWIPKPIDHYVPFVGPEDLAEIIRVPAKLAQLGISDRLVERLVRETGTGSALPLLAYTLHELWMGRDRVEVSLQESTLDALGGVRGVLDHRADEALRSATDGDPSLVSPVLAVLSRLASPEHNPPTRSPIRLGLLDDLERGWLDEFSRVGLVTYRTSYALDDQLAIDVRPTGDDLVDVTHEALFGWAPLEATIDRERLRNRTRLAIERTAQQWDESGRQDDTLLLAGDRLAFARLDRTGERDSVMHAFVGASLRHDRDRRVRRILVSVVAVVAILAVVAAVLALVQRSRAEVARRDADAARVVAQSVRLAAQANQEIGSRRDLAMVTAVAAFQMDRNSDTEGALVNALATPTGPLRYFSDATANWSTLRLAGDDLGVVVTTNLQPATVDLRTRALREIPVPGVEVSEVRPGATPDRVLVVGRQPPSTWIVGTVDLDDESVAAVTRGVEITAAVDLDSGVVFGDIEGNVLFAPRVNGELAEPSVIDRHVESSITDLAVDGPWLASASRRGIRVQSHDADVWDGAIELVAFPRGTRAAERLVFAPGDERVELFAAGSDPTIRKWVEEAGAFVELPAIGRHVGVVNALAIDPDGSVLYTGGRGGQVQRWDARAGALLGDPLLAHGSEVRRLSSTGGGALISTDADGAVLWDLAPARVVERAGVVPAAWELEHFGALVEGDGPLAAISVDGRVLVDDGRVWTAPPRARRAWWTENEALIVETGDTSQVDLAPLDLWRVAGDAPVQLATSLDALDAGPCLAVTAQGRTIEFIDVGACGPPPAAFELDHGEVVELAWSADEQRLLVIHRTGEVEVRSVDGALEASVPRRHGVMTTSALWLTDDRVAVGHDAGARLELIDLRTQDVVEIDAHDDATWWLVVDPAGRRLVSAGQDGLIVQTDLQRASLIGSPLIGALRTEENDPTAVVRGLRLIADGSVLLAIHGDHLVAWELDPQRLTARACDDAQRPLSQSELTNLGLDPTTSPCPPVNGTD